MDVITIEKTGENFRLVFDTKVASPSTAPPAPWSSTKLCKVKRVRSERRAPPTSSRTIRYPDPSVYDTVKVDVATGKITDFIRIDTGTIAMVIGGRNMVRLDVITHRERHDGSCTSRRVATRLGNVFNIDRARVGFGFRWSVNAHI